MDVIVRVVLLLRAPAELFAGSCFRHAEIRLTLQLSR
jgi:hypothetical protein